MQSENIKRYKVELIGTNIQLLPSFVVNDEIQGSGKHIACYIVLENNVGMDINLKVNGTDDVLIRPMEKMEFTAEKHGIIKSIIIEGTFNLPEYFVVEIGYKATSF